MYRASFSICESLILSQRKARDEGEAPYLVQPRADIRAHDELDAFSFGLHEHDPRVLRLGRVGVPTQRLDSICLKKGPRESKGNKNPPVHIRCYPHREKK
jgi:hypothetical protein